MTVISFPSIKVRCSICGSLSVVETIELVDLESSENAGVKHFCSDHKSPSQMQLDRAFRMEERLREVYNLLDVALTPGGYETDIVNISFTKGQIASILALLIQE